MPYLPWFRHRKADAGSEQLDTLPAIRPVRPILARRTQTGSVARGLLVGAGLALPIWPNRPLLALASTVAGGGLGAWAFRRSSQR